MLYSELRARIKGRLLNRVDLDQVIYDYSQDRIAYYSKFFFYSADVTDDSITTSPGQSFYDLPNRMRFVSNVRLLIPGNNQAYATLTSGITLPVGTIPVSTTSGFTITGTLNVGGQIVSYTGITATSFTGCTGGIGLLALGTSVTQIAPSTQTTAGVVLPVSTIPVVTTLGFLPSGVISLGGSPVTYRSLDATDFLTCVGGTGTIASGSLVQQLYGIWLTIYKMKYNDILEASPLSPENKALPSRWGQFNTQLRFFPSPDQAYPIELTGSAAPAPPVNDDDDNFWTQEDGGGTLIIAATTAEIKEQVLNDAEGAQKFRSAEARERYVLMKKTIDLSNPRVLTGHL